MNFFFNGINNNAHNIVLESNLINAYVEKNLTSTYDMEAIELITKSIKKRAEQIVEIVDKIKSREYT